MDTLNQISNYTSYIFIAINILAIILSPLIANIISIKISQRNEQKNEKLKILRVLMMTRINRSCIDYVNALNLIDVVFYDVKKVRQTYKELLEIYKKENVSDKEIDTKNLKLIESIIEDIGYSTKINWDEILGSYQPKWYFQEIERQKKYIDSQILIGNNIERFIMNNKNDKKD